MSLFDIIPYGTTKRNLKKLSRDSKKISTNQSNLSLSYNNLSKASAQIGESIKMLATLDFSAHKAVIQELDLEEDYKKGLIIELDTSRTKAIETLKPLREKAEKLKGNMIVTQEKSLQFLAIIKAQSEIAKAGEIQVGILTSLQETGENLGNRIDELLEECERINQVTESAVAPFRNGGTIETTGTLLGVNPIIGRAKAKAPTAET